MLFKKEAEHSNLKVLAKIPKKEVTIWKRSASQVIIAKDTQE